MKKRKVEGETIVKNKRVEVKLNVIRFEEDGYHYAFLPSLDMMGYGITEDEAKKSLAVMLEEFITYAVRKNTFFLELRRLGWTVKSKTKPIKAPAISDLIDKNDQLKEIVDNKQYSSDYIPMKVPVFAYA